MPITGTARIAIRHTSKITLILRHPTKNARSATRKNPKNHILTYRVKSKAALSKRSGFFFIIMNCDNFTKVHFTWLYPKYKSAVLPNRSERRFLTIYRN
jgi:hypothetical protein